MGIVKTIIPGDTRTGGTLTFADDDAFSAYAGEVYPGLRATIKASASHDNDPVIVEVLSTEPTVWILVEELGLRSLENVKHVNSPTGETLDIGGTSQQLNLGQSGKGIIIQGQISEHSVDTAIPTMAVLAVATAPIGTLSGDSTPIDGTTPGVLSGYVLLTAEADAKNNGPWVWNIGAWTRPLQFTGISAPVIDGWQFAVRHGAVYRGTTWACTNTNIAKLGDGTSNLVISQVVGGASTSLATTGTAVTINSDIPAGAGEALVTSSATVGVWAPIVQQSAYTTKGDFLVASAANTPVVVPITGITDGWVMTKDTASTAGMKWAAAAGGSGAPVYTNAGTIAAPKTSAYTAAIGEVVYCDPTGGAFTVKLPACSGNAGKVVRVVNIGASTNLITVQRADAPGTELINGASTFTGMIFGYQSQEFLTDGVGWVVF